MRVSNTNPLMGKPFPGEKHNGIKTAIKFYKVEDDNKSDSGDKSVIHFKIYKASMANKKNTKKLTYPVIKYFDC